MDSSDSENLEDKKVVNENNSMVNLSDSPHVGGNKMSSSLKERLKRSSRSFSSPMSNVEYPKMQPLTKMQKLMEAPTQSTVKHPIANVESPKMQPVNEKQKLTEVPTHAIVKYPIANVESPKVQPLNEKQKFTEFPTKIIIKYPIANVESPKMQPLNEKQKLTKVPTKIIFRYPIAKLESPKMQPLTEMQKVMGAPTQTIVKYPITNVEPTKMQPQTEKQELTEAPTQTIIKYPTDCSKTENTCSYTIDNIQECQDKEKLQTIFLNLQRESEVEEEKLRKLKLVEKHHAKNKPDELVTLTERWLITAQNALERLLELLNEPKPETMGSLIDMLQIDRDMVKYNPETDSFFDTDL